MFRAWDFVHLVAVGNVEFGHHLQNRAWHESQFRHRSERLSPAINTAGLTCRLPHAQTLSSGSSIRLKRDLFMPRTPTATLAFSLISFHRASVIIPEPPTSGLSQWNSCVRCLAIMLVIGKRSRRAANVANSGRPNLEAFLRLPDMMMWVDVGRAEAPNGACGKVRLPRGASYERKGTDLSFRFHQLSLVCSAVSQGFLAGF